MSIVDGIAAEIEAAHRLDAEARGEPQFRSRNGRFHQNLLVDGLTVQIAYSPSPPYRLWVNGQYVVRGRANRSSALREVAKAVINLLPSLAAEENRRAQFAAHRERSKKVVERMSARGMWAGSERNGNPTYSQFLGVEIPHDVTDESLGELCRLMNEAKASLARWEEQHGARRPKEET